MIDFLLDEFENLASITGSVPKLREIVLQLAVSGRLTADWRHQHPDTEPASELLKRIESEKQRLIKEGKIKKQKPLPEIATDEKRNNEFTKYRYRDASRLMVIFHGRPDHATNNRGSGGEFRS